MHELNKNVFGLVHLAYPRHPGSLYLVIWMPAKRALRHHLSTGFFEHRGVPKLRDSPPPTSIYRSLVLSLVFLAFLNFPVCADDCRRLYERGDVNLNGIPWKVRDAVIFVRVKIYGEEVLFDSSQYWTADIDRDRAPFTVTDLRLLQEEITGKEFHRVDISFVFTSIGLSRSFGITPEICQGLGVIFPTPTFPQDPSKAPRFCSLETDWPPPPGDVIFLGEPGLLRGKFESGTKPT